MGLRLSASATSATAALNRTAARLIEATYYAEPEQQRPQRQETGAGSAETAAPSSSSEQPRSSSSPSSSSSSPAEQPHIIGPGMLTHGRMFVKGGPFDVRGPSQAQQGNSAQTPARRRPALAATAPPTSALRSRSSSSSSDNGSSGSSSGAVPPSPGLAAGTQTMLLLQRKPVSAREWATVKAGGSMALTGLLDASNANSNNSSSSSGGASAGTSPLISLAQPVSPSVSPTDVTAYTPPSQQQQQLKATLSAGSVGMAALLSTARKVQQQRDAQAAAEAEAAAAAAAAAEREKRLRYASSSETVATAAPVVGTPPPPAAAQSVLLTASQRSLLEAIAATGGGGKISSSLASALEQASRASAALASLAVAPAAAPSIPTAAGVTPPPTAAAAQANAVLQQQQKHGQQQPQAANNVRSHPAAAGVAAAAGATSAHAGTIVSARAAAAARSSAAATSSTTPPPSSSASADCVTLSSLAASLASLTASVAGVARSAAVRASGAEVPITEPLLQPDGILRTPAGALVLPQHDLLFYAGEGGAALEAENEATFEREGWEGAHQMQQQQAEEVDGDGNPVLLQGEDGAGNNNDPYARYHRARAAIELAKARAYVERVAAQAPLAEPALRGPQLGGQMQQQQQQQVASDTAVDNNSGGAVNNNKWPPMNNNAVNSRPVSSNNNNNNRLGMGAWAPTVAGAGGQLRLASNYDDDGSGQQQGQWPLQADTDVLMDEDADVINQQQQQQLNDSLDSSGGLLMRRPGPLHAPINTVPGPATAASSYIDPSSLSKAARQLMSEGDAQLAGPEDPPDVIFKGLLMKCDPGGKNWKTRYCVLTPAALLYYRSKARAEADMAAGFKARPKKGDKGEVDLAREALCMGVGPGPLRGVASLPTPWVFRIELPGSPKAGGRCFLFATGSVDALMSWVGALAAITHVDLQLLLADAVGSGDLEAAVAEGLLADAAEVALQQQQQQQEMEQEMQLRQQHQM